jgi:dTDP-4-amino-4,6-dideoxygalactose transaminase
MAEDLATRELPLTEPDLGAEEIAAVTRVLESKWLTSGPVVAEFEAAFAGKLDAARHGQEPQGKEDRPTNAIAVANCTAALHLAYLVLGVGPGDEVICPDLTFVATANAARYTGAQVVLAGTVSADDLTVCPRQIEALITPRTKAIAVVHYAGFACRMDEIMELAAHHGLAVVEDCAHAPFAGYRSADGAVLPLGTIGDVGCFSFFGNKNMTTGEGGLCTTKRGELAAHLRSLRSHGLSRPTWERHQGKELGYEVEALGYNYRFDEIRAAIALCQLAKIERLNQARRELVAAYRTALAEVPGVRVPFAAHDLALSSCHIMSVLVDGDATAVRSALRERGIQTSKHYEPLGSFPTYAGAAPSPSTELAKGLVTLPLGAQMTTDDVAYVAAALHQALGSGRGRSR